MAIVTLALGIGGTIAIFSLMNAVVLRSLPVPHPEQLTALATTIADDVNGDEPFSLQMYLELPRRQAVFSDVFAWSGGTINTFEAQGQRHAAAIASVTGNYFRTIGVASLLGRFLTAGEVPLSRATSRSSMLIAAVGLYGLLSFHIAQRRAEFGIRFALGAQRKDVLWMVEREAITLTGIGCAIGLAGALLLCGLVRSLLFGVSAVSPLIFGAAAMLLLMISLTAGAIPARRAARADPMAVLRAE